MDTQTSYDRVADEYVRRMFDELRHKPLDRQLLDRFAAIVRDVGPACAYEAYVSDILESEVGGHVCRFKYTGMSPNNSFKPKPLRGSA